VTWFRGIAAVLGGYLIFAVSAVALFALSGRDAHQAQDPVFTAVSVLYGAVFAVLAGYVAARLAGRSPLLHAGVVALVIAVGAVASIPSVPEGTFPWSQVAALVLMAPCAVLGGWLAARASPGR
jgi:hypothetical protein